MVPELTTCEKDRITLNSARYAGGIAATLLVLGIAWIQFHFFGVSLRSFKLIAISSIAIGDFFTLIFLIGVKELPLDAIDRKRDSKRASGSSKNSFSGKKFTWRDWFKVRMFYQVGIIYMATRIAVNVSQVYMPFYLQESLDLLYSRPTVIAEVPLLLMLVSFGTAFCLRRISLFAGRQSTFLIGSIFVFGSLCGLFFLPASKWYLAFVGAFVLGIGTTIVQITAYNFEADLVGTRFESGAFVYGALSFADKLANGIAIVLTSKY